MELKDEDIAEATVVLIESAGMTPNCTISNFHDEPSLRRWPLPRGERQHRHVPSSAERTLSPTTLAEDLGVTLVCVAGGERVAFGEADGTPAASEWLGQVNTTACKCANAEVTAAAGASCVLEAIL